jgi:hypothetical protein
MKKLLAAALASAVIFTAGVSVAAGTGQARRLSPYDSTNQECVRVSEKLVVWRERDYTQLPYWVEYWCALVRDTNTLIKLPDLPEPYEWTSFSFETSVFFYNNWNRQGYLYDVLTGESRRLPIPKSRQTSTTTWSHFEDLQNGYLFHILTNWPKDRRVYRVYDLAGGGETILHVEDSIRTDLGSTLPSCTKLSESVRYMAWIDRGDPSGDLTYVKDLVTGEVRAVDGDATWMVVTDYLVARLTRDGQVIVTDLSTWEDTCLSTKGYPWYPNVAAWGPRVAWSDEGYGERLQLLIHDARTGSTTRLAPSPNTQQIVDIYEDAVAWVDTIEGFPRFRSWAMIIEDAPPTAPLTVAPTPAAPTIPVLTLRLAVGSNLMTCEENGEVTSVTLQAAPRYGPGGRVCVPIRPVVEAFGGRITWDEVERKVTIEAGSTLELWIGRPTAVLDGVEVAIDPASAAVNPFIGPEGYTLLPLRFIAESLLATVDWVTEDQSIVITY